MLTILFAVVGVCLGSFATAVIWRNANNISWIMDVSDNAARSQCPSCGHQLSWSDLLPLLSFIFYGGKCRYCKKPIGFFYIGVELFCGACAVLAYAVCGAGALVYAFLAFMPFAVAVFFSVFRGRVLRAPLISALCITVIIFLLALVANH